MINLFKNKEKKKFEDSRESIINAAVHLGVIHILEAANTFRSQQHLSEEATVDIPQSIIKDYMTTTLAILVDDSGINAKKIGNLKLGKLVLDATSQVIAELPENIKVQY
ncbi:hypothetical protein HBG08_003123 [Vibrio parahaemolyticus]|nr:hypothetical protein [Vibrio parahaemolyticus]EGR0839922.1 hypothetical protein [Vibrio parahaemolyticus]